MNETLERPQRAVEADGVNDLMSGACMLCLALLLGLQFYASISNPFSPLVLFLPAFLMPYGITFLKSRFVYPRIGYVALRHKTNKTKMLLPFALVAALPLGTRYMFSSHINNGPVIMLGTLFGVLYAAYFVRFGLWRHLFVAVCSLSIAFIVAEAVGGPVQSMIVFSLILGALMLVAGAIPFFKILRLPALSLEDSP